MERRAAGALLALAACIASTHQAPTVSNQTSLDLYDAASEGCYYNFQHYGEGDRIMTNEPCLNCTCHNRMLMCYLRVCPFTKPIGQDCTVEKRADQCCPIVTCPDVPVDLLTSTSTSSPAEYGATGLGKLDKYGCSINGKYFPEGSKVPPTPNKPCEHCYCIRNMTTCVMQECTLHVDGCTPIYHKDVCCPVRYSCDHPEDEMPLLDDMSTTVRPTPGFLLTTTTLAPVTQMTQDCVHNDQIFPDGTSIKTEKACEHCYCMKGDIVCVVQECGTPMENEGKNCTTVAPREGQCCPDTYICEGDEVTTESVLDYTTEPSLEKLTTLVPPRRVVDEGSGYRKEEEPIVTELPAIEPEVEGSGEEFATVQPSDETEKETPSLIDERISSTEDVLGIDTTPQSDSDIEKATSETDSELNTVPSGTVEPSGTSIPILTTVTDTKTSEEMELTHLYSEHTTASLEHKDEDIPAQTTESVFRKEDESHVPQDVTTENGLEDYTSESEPVKDKQDEGVYTTMKQEPVTTNELESKYTTTPKISEFSQSVTITEIPITTTSDELAKEPSTTSHEDHTERETLTTVMSEKTETTILNAQENEIEDISTTQGPGRIPGEGDCLQNGVTYRNESAVPSVNNCQTECKCISSIIKCDPIICSAPPEYMNNCVPTYDSMESCCPTYVCDGSKETLPPQPHSQMSETASSTPTPAIECEGDQCEIQKVDESPIPVPSEIPQTSDCESEDCKGTAQTPVQSGCTSEGCDGEIKPVLHETPSPVASESCSNGECNQEPIEKDDSLHPCEGDNCKIQPIQPCQNEEECKNIDVPKVEVPCEGESCKIEPTDCTEESCKRPSEMGPVLPVCEGDNCKISPTEPCQNEEECKTINIPKVELPCEGESCKIEPTDCNEEGCKIPPEPSSVSPICEGDNCKLFPVKPCENEEECKTIDVPKVELPCKGESCKTGSIGCNDEGCPILPESVPAQPACEGDSCQIESTDCTGEGCKIPPETVPVQPTCEGESCISNEEQQPECTSEECKKKITPHDSEQLPPECYGVDCLSETSELPEKTEVSATESPIQPQDKETEIPSVTFDYIQPESTSKMPETDEYEQPQTSEIGKGSTTEKSVDVDTQTVEYTEETDKTQTPLPEIKSTEHEGIKETTSLPELESHTESKQEPESMTTPTMSLDTADKGIEVSKTTEFDDLVTRTPEVQASTEIFKETEGITDVAKLPEEQNIPVKTFEPEVTTEKMEDASQPALLSDLKPEIEITESTIRETTTQPETGSSPELNIEPDISAIPSLDVPDLETGEELATTESPIKSTEQSISDDIVPVTETDISMKEGEGTSQVPVESSEIDEKITTTPYSIMEVSTEETRSGTSATPELYTTSSKVDDELHDKKTETPDIEIQEPITQTISSPKPHIDSEEPAEQDSDITSKSDSVPSITEPSILPETGIAETEKPITDEEKIPKLPSEEFYTDQPEINTEEPITSEDKVTQQEPIEPESPDYIPVHPTTADKSEFDLIDKETTPEIIPSTDHKVYSTTPEPVLGIHSQEPDKELVGVPELEDDAKTSPPVYKDQYDQNTQATEASIDISPTDTRKYNKDTTDIFEQVTTIDELTTSYPIQEKLSESPTYSESTTSKPLIEEEPHTTLHDKIFSTEKQDVIPTEAPESHVKETESDVKLATILETFTTETSEPVKSEEPQTPPSILEPKPTEFQSPTESVDIEQEKPKPEDDSEMVTIKVSEHTSEPKYDYTETPPDMIELVEHNIMDISTLPSSISDERTTTSPETVKPDDQSSTEKLETSTSETYSDKATAAAAPLPEDKITDEVLSTPPDEHDTIPEHPEKVDSNEKVPDVEISSQKPEIDEKIPTQEATTEITETDKEYSSKQPDTSNLEQETEGPEIPGADIDLTTKQPEESVTDLKIKLEEEFVTEEPGSGEIEVKPDKEYSTEKSDIETIPMIEQESTTMVSEQPSIDEQSVTDKTKEKEKPFIDNEIIPVEENIEPTAEVEKENIPEEETVTGAPEVAITEQEIIPEQDISTESPKVPEIIQEPEIESSTEHEILPERDGVEESVPTTEKQSPVVEESATIEPELETPDTGSFTTASEPPIFEDEMKLQPSTEQPEQNIVTDKELVTELPVISELDHKTQSPGIKDDLKPDEELITVLPEKEYTTKTPEIEIDKETPAKEPEPSDIEKEPTYESTTILSEKPMEETVTNKPSSEDKVISSEIEPTERITIPESESVTEGLLSVTEEPDKVIVESDISPEPTTVVPQSTEEKLEKTTEKSEEQATISLEPVTETEKPDISEDHMIPEVITKEPELSESSTPEQGTEPQRRYPTDKPELSDVDHEVTTEPIEAVKEPIVTEHGLLTDKESVTEEPKKPEDVQKVKDEYPPSSVSVENEITEKPTTASSEGGYNDKETPTTISEHIDELEKLTTSAELSSTPSSIEKEEVPEKLTEATPIRYDDNTKPGVEITEYTTPGYTVKDEVTVSESESEKPIVPEEGISVPIQSETEKPISVELTKDTTAPEEEFLTVTTKATTPKTESEISTHSEDLDKTSKPQETQEETTSAPTPEIPKPGLNDVQATDEVPVPEEEGHFPPSATGGYGQEPDYEDENQPFGPGTCRYGGKVYVSAQQIPRDDPCDFCFCFRSDIICLQQSCPPPIHGCHEEPIQGFCCPRYECPVSMASTLNITTTTTTTTTTLPPHFLPHAYQGAVQRRGCQIKGHTYKVGEVVRASSGPCLHCTCGGDGQMKCDPKACTPEPMLRQMIAAAVSAKRRR